jgi:integrase
LGLTHPQFEAMLTAARESTNCNDFALVAMLGLLGLRIFEAAGSNVEDLGEEHGHRALRVVGKGTKVVLVPLPPAVGRAIDRAVEDRATARSCETPMEWATGPALAPTRWHVIVTAVESEVHDHGLFVPHVGLAIALKQASARA